MQNHHVVATPHRESWCGGHHTNIREHLNEPLLSARASNLDSKFKDVKHNSMTNDSKHKVIKDIPANVVINDYTKNIS